MKHIVLLILMASCGPKSEPATETNTIGNAYREAAFYDELPAELEEGYIEDELLRVVEEEKKEE